MNPTENNMQTPVQSVPPVAPQVPGVPPKKSKNLMMVGIILMVVFAIVASAGLYIYMSMPPKESSENVTSSSNLPSVSKAPDTSEATVVVNDDSDLENLLVELASADEGFDEDLDSLEKDSDF